MFKTAMLELQGAAAVVYEHPHKHVPVSLVLQLHLNLFLARPHLPFLSHGV